MEKLIRSGHQARRTCDSALLYLLQMWLKALVVEPDRGSVTSSTSTRKPL